jgi:hypothetical protein
MVIWNILQAFGICYGHLVHFRAIWYIFSRFGMLHREKSGNPDVDSPLNRGSLPQSPFVGTAMHRFALPADWQSAFFKIEIEFNNVGRNS